MGNGVRGVSGPNVLYPVIGVTMREFELVTILRQ